MSVLKYLEHNQEEKKNHETMEEPILQHISKQAKNDQGI